MEADDPAILERHPVIYSVVFLISVVIALVAMLSIPKRETALKWFPLCVLIQTATACLFFGFLNKLGVSFSLLIPILVNVVITILCALVLIRGRRLSAPDADAGDTEDGEAMRFEFATRLDVVALCMILLTTVAVFFFQFSVDIYPDFSSGDAARHIRMSLDITKGEPVGSLFFSHFFIGCFMSAASPFIETMDQYKVFILCETFLFFLSACMFYTLISTLAKNANPIVLLVVTLLYMLGFPWNNLVIGFSYLGVGVTLITAIVFVCYRFDLNFKDVRDLPGLLFLALLLSSLTISYSLFIPPVFLAIAVYVIVTGIRSKAAPVRTIISLGVIFLLPILTFSVFTGFQILIGTGSGAEAEALNEAASTEGDGAISAMALDGYAFRDIFADALFILPLSVYGMVLLARNRTLIATNLISAFFLAYQLLFLAGVFAGILGTYYYSKLNYVLWLILFIYATFGIEVLRKRSRGFFTCYASVWLALLLIVFTGLNRSLGESEPELYNSDTLAGIFSVYDYNIYTCHMPHGELPTVGKDDLALYGKGAELEDDDRSVMVIGEDRTIAWYNLLTDSEAGIRYWDYTDEELMDRLHDADYLIIQTTYIPGWETKSGTKWQDLVDKLTEDTVSVWSNGEGHILKVNK